MTRIHQAILFTCENRMAGVPASCFVDKAYRNIRCEVKQLAGALAVVCSKKGIA